MCVRALTWAQGTCRSSLTQHHSTLLWREEAGRKREKRGEGGRSDVPLPRSYLSRLAPSPVPLSLLPPSPLPPSLPPRQPPAHSRRTAVPGRNSIASPTHTHTHTPRPPPFPPTHTHTHTHTHTQRCVVRALRGKEYRPSVMMHVTRRHSQRQS